MHAAAPNLPTVPRPTSWERGYHKGRKDLANRLREILRRCPNDAEIARSLRRILHTETYS